MRLGGTLALALGILVAPGPTLAAEAAREVTCSATTFLEPRNFLLGAGSVPRVADFNGDGKMDLAGLTYASLAILLGNGDGTFAPPVVTVLAFSSAFAVGKFDDDAKTDAVVAQFGEVQFFRGKGDGTFEAPVASTLPVGISQQLNVLEATDYDGDGKLDLVGLPSFGNQLVLLKGAGDGTFVPSVTPALPFNVGSPLVADLDGDGTPDIAATSADGTVAVLLGQGAGVFGEPSFYIAGSTLTSLVSADLNGDGAPDLLATSNGFPGASIAVLFGNGDGSFQAAIDYDVGSDGTSLTLADFNGDGILDAALVSGRAGGVPVVPSLAVLPGLGEGVFGPFRAFAGPIGSIAVVAADFDGDGHADIAELAGDGVWILRGDGEGGFAAPLAASYNGQVFASGDFDGDGNLDNLVVRSSGNTASLFFFGGKGDGTDRPPVRAVEFGGFLTVALGDLNLDGRLDFVTFTGFGQPTPFLGDGDGTFQQGSPLAPAATSLGQIAVADWTGDGKPDVAVAVGNVNGILLIPGNGDGTFRDSVFTSLSIQPNRLVPADPNGDGSLDIVVTSFEGFGTPNQLEVLFGDGSGHFVEGASLVANAEDVAVGDFDEDGLPDLAATVPNTAQIQLLFGNGDGTFTLPVHVALSGGGVGVAQADFDGDGHEDLAVSVAGEYGVNLLRGIGNGHFQSPKFLPDGGVAGSLTVASLHAAGGPDLLVGNIVLLRNSRISVAPPLSRVACLGSAASFRAIASGFGPLAYQWRHNGTPLVDGGTLSGAHSATLTVSSAGAADAGDYDVVVSDSCGSATSASAALELETKPSAPVISAPASVPPGALSVPASVPMIVGHTYSWTVVGGTLVSGQGTNQITFAGGSPGTAVTLRVEDSTAGGCASDPSELQVFVDFLDVPSSNLFHDAVVAIAKAGVTTGCGAGNYCPTGPINRASVAAFILRGKHGGAFIPPPATGTVFSDVTSSTPLARWVEAFFSEGITTGCGGGRYCPDVAVTRDAVAVFLLRGRNGSSYEPPAATGTVFGDVATTTFLAKWIEELKTEGIASGCGGGNYCPGAVVTRGEMAALMKKAFGL